MNKTKIKINFWCVTFIFVTVAYVYGYMSY